MHFLESLWERVGRRARDLLSHLPSRAEVERWVRDLLPRLPSREEVNWRLKAFFDYLAERLSLSRWLGGRSSQQVPQEGGRQAWGRSPPLVEEERVETFVLVAQLVGLGLIVAGAWGIPFLGIPGGSQYLVAVGLLLAISPPVVANMVYRIPAELFRYIGEALEAVEEALKGPQAVGAGVGRLLGRLPRGGLGKVAGGLVRRAAAPFSAFGKAIGGGLRRRVVRLASVGTTAAAIGLSISFLLIGDDDGGWSEPAGAPSSVGEAAARAGGAVAVDPGWLEGLGRAWFTYEGEGRWLAGLEPYLIPGAVGVLRECLHAQSRIPPVLRLARTTIVEGPWVEVMGRLAELEYGPWRIPGEAVGHPEIKKRYGVELGPDDVGVRLSAAVARELPPDKAWLPGAEMITRPQRESVQFFIVGGRAVPDVGYCGRGVAFIG